VPDLLDKIEDEGKNSRFPYIVLVISVLITLGVTYFFYQSANNKDAVRFNNEAVRLHSAFENRISLYISLLKGGRGFVESSSNLRRVDFENYVKSLELERNYTGTLGIGYTKVIKPNERKALIEKMVSEGFHDYRIIPDGERDLYQVIVYLEPLNERNRKAIGFDMSTEVNRREALNRARDTGQAAASSQVILIQDSDSVTQKGFLIYLPIYRNGDFPESLETRRENLDGYIYSPFRAQDFLSEIQSDKASTDIAIKIYDGEVREDKLLAQTEYVRNGNVPNQAEDYFTAENELDVAGKKWIIRYGSLPTFAAQSSLGWAPLIFVAGVLFSFLLFGMTYWEATARAALQVTAAELYKLEQQKQGLLEKEQKARQTAEQANKIKDEFIAVVSHELRTPLNAIAGWTRILRTENLLDNTRKMALEKIDKNLRQQTKIVEEVLDYSQILSGNVDFEDKDIDFSALFESVFNEMEPLAEEKNIELIKENELNGQRITGDEEKLKIVLQNLLTNALKFTPHGGQVKAAVSQSDSSIKMCIKDNGKGISPEFLPHIFDRFTQADSSTTRNYGGIGLGLTISNHIVNIHNGTIEAASKGQGFGSEFTVKLPLKKKQIKS
jgi:signal transduction histidine kinase